MNHYERIAEVIRYLDEHHAEQPDLAFLAARNGLSPFHFHRLFSTWAGVTPKDFLQCLTLTRVKEALRRGQSVLDASLNAGLSGPGRLHDLCVSVEAASPGEMKSGGNGWTISAGFASSPFGTCLIAESPRGICHLAFIGTGEEQSAWLELRQSWPKAKLSRAPRTARRLSRMIFNEPQTGHKPVPLKAFVRGTPFQLRVWRALIQIPPGQLVTYGRLAGMIGSPTAARAVGSAVGANPLAFLIPCHRVIRETGIVGEYRWGRIRKRAMIAREALG
ncbi:MAG TPA: methylated-DNA--[protein]-cysteine S-methyltransferase [Candidatus Paceibacterota bacterium]|nr:methylated-DNA--[protein]-cysteine S-methyltransferase [Candidatus Paceibacterota bacterium]